MRVTLSLAVFLLAAAWVCPGTLPSAMAAEPPAVGTGVSAEDDYDDDDDTRRVTVRDPLEPFNRDMFIINDFLLLYVLEPAAKGVKAVVPWEFRTVFRNALRNIRFPVRFVSCLLQGKWEKGVDEFAAFFLNTPVGFLGRADVAAAYPGLSASPEAMGQTLAVWGWEASACLTLPFFGPATSREALGPLPDGLLDPLFWYSNLALSFSLRGGEAVNDTTFRIGDYAAIKKASLDPYVAIRNGFIQNRNKLIAE